MKSMFVRAQDPADVVPVPGTAVRTGEQPSVVVHRRRTRIEAVDLLRGLVMVIMALDHTRDFVHGAAMNASPEDLRSTTAAIFLLPRRRQLFAVAQRPRDDRLPTVAIELPGQAVPHPAQVVA